MDLLGIGNIVKGIFPSVERILDDVITNKEELQTVLNELKKLENEKEAIIEQEVTKRWESDNAQDSWLPRNIRPLVLAFLVVSTILLIFIDAGTIQFVVDDEWKSLLQIVLITVIGAYFGSRGLEKIKK